MAFLLKRHFDQMCLGELRERVARGGDPTKWREAPILNDDDDDVNNEKGTF